MALIGQAFLLDARYVVPRDNSSCASVTSTSEVRNLLQFILNFLIRLG